MPASPTHQHRVEAHREREEKMARERAKAIFDLVSTLAQTRRFVTDKELQTRITAALLNAHIALRGFVPGDLPSGVVPIVERKAS